MFEVDNEEYKIKISTICEIFGFPNHDLHAYPHKHNYLETWLTIGDRPKGSKIRANTIRHPALRYAHRFLANTIFWRHEKNTVQIEEYYTLMSPYLKDDLGVNLGMIFARNLVAIRDWADKTPVQKPVICVGSMITPILEAVGIDLSNYDSLEGEERITLNHLRSTRWCLGDDPTGRVIYPIDAKNSQDAILLPNSHIKPLAKTGPDFRPPPEHLYHPSSMPSTSTSAPPSAPQEPSTSQPPPTRTHELEMENATLRAKLSFHERAISALVGIVRKLTPKSFKRRTRQAKAPRNFEVGESSTAHETFIQEFLEDYAEEDEEEPMHYNQSPTSEHTQVVETTEPLEEAFMSNFQPSPTRHSSYVGEVQEPQHDIQMRHSIHDDMTITEALNAMRAEARSRRRRQQTPFH